MKKEKISNESYQQYLRNYKYACKNSKRDSYNNDVNNVYERIYYWQQVKTNLEICYI